MVSLVVHAGMKGANNAEKPLLVYLYVYSFIVQKIDVYALNL